MPKWLDGLLNRMHPSRTGVAPLDQPGELVISDPQPHAHEKLLEHLHEFVDKIVKIEEIGGLDFRLDYGVAPTPHMHHVIQAITTRLGEQSPSYATLAKMIFINFHAHWRNVRSLSTQELGYYKHFPELMQQVKTELLAKEPVSADRAELARAINDPGGVMEIYNNTVGKYINSLTPDQWTELEQTAPVESFTEQAYAKEQRSRPASRTR